MEKSNLKNQAEIKGWIGGQISGYKRKQKALFLINFIKMIEMLEYPAFKLTSSLAKKLIAGFNEGKSISNNYLIGSFAEAGNKAKQANLDDLVLSLVERHQEMYIEQWTMAKTQIDKDVIELKAKLKQELREST